jgi:exportin-1
MKETYPGIMEMACNAFLKICKSTSEQFTMLQQNEQEPFIREVIRRMPDTIKAFPHDTLQYIFYESVGHLISSEP